jgi:hypothetical protein
MLKITATRCDSGCSLMTRAVLSVVVATAGILSLAASAQAQTPMISQSTIGPGRVIASLDALPQITPAELGVAWVKPYLNPDDSATFAARKAAAKTSRFAAQGGTTWDAPAQMLSGPSVSKDGGSSQTVNPPEAAFTATSNAQCGAVSGFSVTPADQALAVGDTLVGVLQGINICLSVFDKNGTLQATYPKSAKNFFGLGAGVANSDPRMIYDWINHRYIYVLISYDGASCGTNCLAASHYQLAISSGDNPAGGWCTYQLNVGTGPDPDAMGHYFLNDFPRLGQDRQAIYIASNLYRPGYVSEEILAIPKSFLYTCGGGSYTIFFGFGALSGNGFTIQPANVFSPNDQPKSMYFVTGFCCGSDNRLVISAIHSPLSSPTFSRITITAANTYSTPPDATQQGTSTLIATGDERISGSPFYAAGSIYTALATNGGNTEPGLIEYQIQPFVDTSGGANDGKITGARILNEITHFGSGTNAFYYPAEQPDGEGNVTTVFGFSNSTTFASLAYATRRAAQATGTWPDSGVFAYNGTGAYTGGRWGDYWATAPAGLVSGGGTGGFPKMWFAGMWATTGNNWGTAIGRTGFITIGQD